MKRKKAALYDPYLDVLGGGERYILSILKELEEFGYDPFIFWDSDLTNDISKQLNIQFNSPLQFYPNIFRGKSGLLKKLSMLNGIDILLYVTDGSYFFSPAKKTFIYCMVPQRSLYPSNIVNKAKTANAKFITHSYFVRDVLKQWGTNSTVLYPYLSQDFMNTEVQHGNKDKIIISVGRFFEHLHSKRHDITIELYKKLKQKSALFDDYKLVIAGGLKKEDSDYFNKLQFMADNDKSITLVPNISYAELLKLYNSAEYYWHMAGYGVDQKIHPEQVEHLGITPLEAMASGCITFCYNAGGLKELIADGKTGFLFTDETELFNKIISVHTDAGKKAAIVDNAKSFIPDTFSKNSFNRQVKNLIT